MTEDFSDIPSQQPNTDLSVPVFCLQQSGTDRYAGAETCSPQLQQKNIRKICGGREFSDEETTASS